jgi:hypothetical protein
MLDRVIVSDVVGVSAIIRLPMKLSYYWRIELDVAPQIFAAIRKGRMTVPLGDHPDMAAVGGLPWCSIATLKTKARRCTVS